MTAHWVTFVLNGNADAVHRSVRRMLDAHGFTDVAFDLRRVGRGSVPKRETPGRNRTLRIPDDIWQAFRHASAARGISTADLLINAGVQRLNEANTAKGARSPATETATNRDKRDEANRGSDARALPAGSRRRRVPG